MERLKQAPEGKFIKSSRSLERQACVEVAKLDANTVGIRDSKDPQGGKIIISQEVFKGFIGDIKSGVFDKK